MTRRLSLKNEWILGERIGQGGFGRVLEASSEEVPNAAAKLIPKGPGAEREMLFVDLAGARNVVPIIDSGETEDSWVLVMPRAENSLRDYIKSTQGPFPLREVLPILIDIATALSDLQGRVVHRDLKPENVLLLDGHWSLADFGISRYAEASTAPDTRKYAMTYPYAAPEQWRGIRTTSATDVYALGVIGYELLTGNWPFPGPRDYDFREQHLHRNPEPLSGVPLPIAALIDECLYKGPEARPTPSNLLARLSRAAEASPSAGLARLQQAHLDEVNRMKELTRSASVALSEEEQREQLAQSAGRTLTRVMDYLRDAILANAPLARFYPLEGVVHGWEITLRNGELKFTTVARQYEKPRPRSRHFHIDVVVTAKLSVFGSPTEPQPYRPNRHGYKGRSHSLWYCDAQVAGEYHWYETAFITNPLVAGPDRDVEPYALHPGPEAAGAIGPGIMKAEVAWPFTPLSIEAIDDFVDRWASWLAAASQDKLLRPTTLPEKPVRGSWRER